MFTDLTEKAKLINTKDKNAFKNHLLSSVNHELRTPANFTINSMENFIDELVIVKDEIIVKKKKLDEKDLNAIVEKLGQTIFDSSLIIKSLKHMLLVITSFVDFGLIDTGSIDINIEDFKIKDVIDDVVDLYSEQIKANNVKINLIIGNDLQEDVWCSDSIRVNIILSAIISNSIKFTENGTIDVKVKRFSSELMKIEIKDSGQGMVKEQLRIVQGGLDNYLDSEKTENSAGIGLGLKISQALLYHLSTLGYNKLTISSETEIGTIVVFYLSFLTEDKKIQLQLESDDMSEMQSACSGFEDEHSQMNKTINSNK